jgi:uncharacterized membrane protein YuzA (DUF378 family)
MREDYPANRRDNPLKILDYIAIILLIIGGLNWGLVGAADIDAVASLFGIGSIITRIIYILIALAALYYIFQWKDIHYRDCCGTSYPDDRRPPDSRSTMGNNR